MDADQALYYFLSVPNVTMGQFCNGITRTGLERTCLKSMNALNVKRSAESMPLRNSHLKSMNSNRARLLRKVSFNPGYLKKSELYASALMWRQQRGCKRMKQ